MQLHFDVGVHLLSHWPLSLWWKLIHFTGTQSHCDIQVSAVYLAQVLPRYPFIDQNFWEDEQLGELCVDCPRPGSNLGQQIRSRTC